MSGFRSLYSRHIHGGAVGQGQWARHDGQPFASNPWTDHAARAEWETGWIMEDQAQKAYAERQRTRMGGAWANRLDT